MTKIRNSTNPDPSWDICMFDCRRVSYHSLFVSRRINDIKPKTTVRIKFGFYPYKTGKKTLYVDFDCSLFRDIKKECAVVVAKY